MEGLTGEREHIITGCKGCLCIESMVFNIYQSYYFNILVYSLKFLSRTPLKMKRRGSGSDEVAVWELPPLGNQGPYELIQWLQ